MALSFRKVAFETSCVSWGRVVASLLRVLVVRLLLLRSLFHCRLDAKCILFNACPLIVASARRNDQGKWRKKMHHGGYIDALCVRLGVSAFAVAIRPGEIATLDCLGSGGQTKVIR